MFSIIFVLLIFIITTLECIELFFCKKCNFIKIYIFICVILLVMILCRMFYSLMLMLM